MFTQKLSTLLLLLGLFWAQKGIGQYTANFQLKNEYRVDSVFHFDIYMQGSPDSSFLSRGLMYVYYNTNAFGNDPAQTVTPIHEDLIDDSVFMAPKYGSQTPVPNGNRFAVTFKSNFENITPPQVLFHSLVRDTQIAIYHIEMQMQDTTLCPCVALDGSLMNGEQYYFNPNFNNALPFDSVSNPREIRYGVGVLAASAQNFRAISQESQAVLLTWEHTLAEEGTRFILQKQKGNEGFHELTSLSQTSSEEIKSYRYLDQSPMALINRYRLHQINPDGSSSYSKVLEIQMDLENFIQVYPNPVKEVLSVEIQGEVALGSYNYSIHDLSGRNLLQGKLDQTQKDITVRDLPSGTYLFQVSGFNGAHFVKKITKE